jgi:lauroyl/myristoyl acyltransferase
MPVTLWFEGDGWGVDVGAEIPVPDEGELGDRKERVVAMTQQLARFFEAGIREHPQDWHMLQRVFTADLDPERLARAEQRAAQQDDQPDDQHDDQQDDQRGGEEPSVQAGSG